MGRMSRLKSTERPDHRERKGNCEQAAPLMKIIPKATIVLIATDWKQCTRNRKDLPMDQRLSSCRIPNVEPSGWSAPRRNVSQHHSAVSSFVALQEGLNETDSINANIA